MDHYTSLWSSRRLAPEVERENFLTLGLLCEWQRCRRADDFRPTALFWTAGRTVRKLAVSLFFIDTHSVWLPEESWYKSYFFLQHPSCWAVLFRRKVQETPLVRKSVKVIKKWISPYCGGRLWWPEGLAGMTKVFPWVDMALLPGANNGDSTRWVGGGVNFLISFSCWAANSRSTRYFN